MNEIDTLGDLVWREARAAHARLLTRWHQVRFDRTVIGSDIQALPNPSNDTVTLLLWRKEHAGGAYEARPYTLMTGFHLSAACDGTLSVAYSTDECVGWDNNDWDVVDACPHAPEQDIRPEDLAPLVKQWLDALMERGAPV